MKTLNKILFFILVLLLITTVVIGLGIFFQNTYPKITVNGSDTSTTTVGIEFPFKDDIVQGEITISLAPYNGAKVNGTKTSRTFGDAWDAEKYYLAISNDPAQDEMYAALLGFFDDYAIKHNLTSDEYVELLSTYTQSIPYQTAGLEVKFPIETVIDNWGDCDDRSVLLAGLLSRKGYDTGVINFENENHMTAAVKGGNETAYGNTSYSIIETTRYAYIGEISDVIRNETSTGNFSVYQIGEGQKSYTASYEVSEILNAQKEAYITIQTLYDELSTQLAVIKEQEALLRSSWNMALYREYEQNIDTYNDGITTRDEYIGLINTISSGSYDREEVYQTVISMM